MRIELAGERLDLCLVDEERLAYEALPDLKIIEIEQILAAYLTNAMIRLPVARLGCIGFSFHSGWRAGFTKRPAFSMIAEWVWLTLRPSSTAHWQRVKRLRTVWSGA